MKKPPAAPTQPIRAVLDEITEATKAMSAASVDAGKSQMALEQSVRQTRAAQEIATAAVVTARDAQRAFAFAVSKYGPMSTAALAAKSVLDGVNTEAMLATNVSAQLLGNAAPQIADALRSLDAAMQSRGIAADDSRAILQTFATTIAQAQAKAAMRQENTPK